MLNNQALSNLNDLILLYHPIRALHSQTVGLRVVSRVLKNWMGGRQTVYSTGNKCKSMFIQTGFCFFYEYMQNLQSSKWILIVQLHKTRTRNIFANEKNQCLPDDWLSRGWACKAITERLHSSAGVRQPVSCLSTIRHTANAHRQFGKGLQITAA